MSNHPDNAIKVSFCPFGGHNTKYYIWQIWSWFYWEAQGTGGREANQEAAMRAAREYISLGVNGLKSHGEHHTVFNNESL